MKKYYSRDLHYSIFFWNCFVESSPMERSPFKLHYRKFKSYLHADQIAFRRHAVQSEELSYSAERISGQSWFLNNTTSFDVIIFPSSLPNNVSNRSWPEIERNNPFSLDKSVANSPTSIGRSRRKKRRRRTLHLRISARWKEFLQDFENKLSIESWEGRNGFPVLFGFSDCKISLHTSSFTQFSVVQHRSPFSPDWSFDLSLLSLLLPPTSRTPR